uniref:SsrA-binding protein n=2 Tax=unclassified bacterial viruses TaxID=12333 RepID=A0AAU6VY71_9VIRU
MATLDIRKSINITKITFAEKRELWFDATDVTKHSNGGIIINCDERSSQSLLVKDRETVDNLIAALEKTKELGWV